MLGLGEKICVDPDALGDGRRRSDGRGPFATRALLPIGSRLGSTQGRPSADASVAGQGALGMTNRHGRG
ncbi:MAG: hypothetical protein BGO98_49070 [Myxococcales bacterium 68-20]|nr:MAG: hypothetical protein BGO98_49070 [Myxococcales bacterium 68-20]